ncbi:MAG: metallophosphoesterase family protein [Candidatus Cloacimonetes bacterium]|nr:metallophosphoesterase family protein [Candidatus Cloacimonadota bacterium]
MKRIIIISDTHKNQILLRKAFRNEINCDYIFHLGDFFEDMDDNPDLCQNKILCRVPGIYCPGYLDRSVPALLKLEILNWKLLLIHDLNSLREQLHKTDIIFYGHTHKWDYQHKNNQHLINPGHLKAETDRAREASYATVDLTDQKAELKIKSLAGKILMTAKFNKNQEEI